MVDVLTQSLALEYAEEKLGIDGAPGLSAVLTTKVLSLSDVDQAAMEEYTAELVAARGQQTEARTKAQIQACIGRVNGKNQALVEQMAAEVSRTQTLSVLGDIALSTVSDSTVTLEWTGVSGDTNHRIQMLDQNHLY